jgi:trimeric autotransporter adhesin
MSRIRRSLSFSNVVAVMALFFALGGSAYAVAAGKIDGSQIAASSIPGNRLEAKAVGTNQLKPSSIGNAQLKGNAVATKQLQSGAVTGGKIKAGSVGASQIQSGSITGTQVKSGSLGATQINQTTLTGISAANIHAVQYVTSTVALVSGSEIGTSTTATCPSGMKVIGGGATLNNKEFGSIGESAPNGERNGWYANGYLFSEKSVSLTVTAICTPVATTTG